MDFSLSTPLSKIPGFMGPLLMRLEKLKLKTAKDLLYYFPFRYQDFSNIKPIAALVPNEVATVHGIIEKISVSKTRWKKYLVITARIVDKSGKAEAVWFNQRFLLNRLKEGLAVNIAGKVSFVGKRAQFQSPEFEIISHDNTIPRHTGKLVPIYPETKGVTSKSVRLAIEKLLPHIQSLQEFLPNEIIQRNKFPVLVDAFIHIHQPDSIIQAEAAKKRFMFQDLFLLQLLKAKEKYRITQKKSWSFPHDDKHIQKYLSYLPFNLTRGQKKALNEILNDLKQPHVTHRLLQGDVGSGKTVVAAIAALVVASHQKQAVFMVPTEVLAHQHYKTFTSLYEEFEGGVGLLTASHTAVFFGKNLQREITKKELLEYIKNGKIKIIIGTHAVIQKNVLFEDVGLVIIDEQHRFGVAQRALLSDAKNSNHQTNPHLLSMSATPIPRSLALTLFGDLELSMIDELPKNRKKIDTRIVPAQHRSAAYAFVRSQIKKGRQAFVICPRIQPADPEQKLTPRQLLQLDVKNVITEYERLSKKIFPSLQVGMLHGKLKSSEKNAVMQKFKEKELDILVSTSVIEVGIDVPNASIMLIEGSEHFGLSQLYQFRGRVGRGEHQSYCFLFTESRSKTTLARLKALINAKNGFELAEMDLKFRGPGQFLGTEQTGLPDLAMEALRNPTLVKEAYKSVQDLFCKDPQLTNHPLLAAYIKLFSQNIHLE